jgi:hypothetical protein
MAFPTTEPKVEAAERELGVKFPREYRDRLLARNGGELSTAGDDWQVFPVFDSTSRKTAGRSTGRVVQETRNARTSEGFPPGVVAIASNGSGDYLVLMPKVPSGQLGPQVQVWDHETRKCKPSPLRKVGRSLRWPLVYISLFLVNACAHTNLVEHGIEMTVYGVSPVSDVKIAYGKEVISFPGVRRPGNGGLWNAPMPVPEQMSIVWTTSGQPNEVSIPLKDKLSKTDRIANWRLKFYGEQVELWRQDDDPGNKYYFKPAIQVYP